MPSVLGSNAKIAKATAVREISPLRRMVQDNMVGALSKPLTVRS